MPPSATRDQTVWIILESNVEARHQVNTGKKGICRTLTRPRSLTLGCTPRDLQCDSVSIRLGQSAGSMCGEANPSLRSTFPSCGQLVMITVQDGPSEIISQACAQDPSNWASSSADGSRKYIGPVQKRSAILSLLDRCFRGPQVNGFKRCIMKLSRVPHSGTLNIPEQANPTRLTTPAEDRSIASGDAEFYMSANFIIEKITISFSWILAGISSSYVPPPTLFPKRLDEMRPLVENLSPHLLENLKSNVVVWEWDQYLSPSRSTKPSVSARNDAFPRTAKQGLRSWAYHHLGLRKSHEPLYKALNGRACPKRKEGIQLWWRGNGRSHFSKSDEALALAVKLPGWDWREHWHTLLEALLSEETLSVQLLAPHGSSLATAGWDLYSYVQRSFRRSINSDKIWRGCWEKPTDAYALQAALPRINMLRRLAREPRARNSGWSTAFTATDNLFPKDVPEIRDAVEILLDQPRVDGSNVKVISALLQLAANTPDGKAATLVRDFSGTAGPGGYRPYPGRCTVHQGDDGTGCEPIMDWFLPLVGYAEKQFNVAIFDAKTILSHLDPLSDIWSHCWKNFTACCHLDDDAIGWSAVTEQVVLSIVARLFLPEAAVSNQRYNYPGPALFSTDQPFFRNSD
ncbi:uncharacterized protein EV422DRAFT_509774 [Fimicolochytrium jonesii]|uniref:uncharacterized protein n=1 Tax=Fimicolochytrium jonesii TaxID=1396493 RepID=UPI0022FF2345|nr:uncharacterized protein EV422DRAFT_509774 [Fimicolochytrium jonesii]KAI8816551.1 hypothetical protein EV422DRAFT_509774 [Fimicolochytrium jonesii]